MEKQEQQQLVGLRGTGVVDGLQADVIGSRRSSMNMRYGDNNKAKGSNLIVTCSPRYREFAKWFQRNGNRPL